MSWARKWKRVSGGHLRCCVLPSESAVDVTCLSGVLSISFSLNPPFLNYQTSQDVRRSRGVYMSAKDRARRCPDDILVIAIDGSDQSSYGTPYFAQKTKNSSKGHKMKWKLIGALASGRLMHFFTIGANWEAGKTRHRLIAWYSLC